MTAAAVCQVLEVDCATATSTAHVEALVAGVMVARTVHAEAAVWVTAPRVVHELLAEPVTAPPTSHVEVEVAAT